MCLLSLKYIPPLHSLEFSIGNSALESLLFVPRCVSPLSCFFTYRKSSSSASVLSSSATDALHVARVQNVMRLRDVFTLLQQQRKCLSSSGIAP